MTLDSVPSEARPSDSHHPRLGAVGRTVNRPLQERSPIGLSPPPVVAVASSIRVHTLQGRVIDALAEVASDNRLATVVPLEAHTWLPHSTCWPRGTCSASRVGRAARCPAWVLLGEASHRRAAFTPPGSPIRECGRARGSPDTGPGS
jgi:hypothetical protein